MSPAANRDGGALGKKSLRAQMTSALHAFRNRILNDFLPTFCNDPSRSWGADGFKADWCKICELDAADFLRGIDGGLIKHVGRGQYLAPRSYAKEQFFWSGAKQKTPRPMTLWVEPIITIAVLARLHFDLGWPKKLIGTQTKDWAFDAATYLSSDSHVEYIACEVKKSTTELEHLVDVMNRFGKAPHGDGIRAPKEENAFKKLEALRSRRPAVFWAVGPGGSNYAFKMGYAKDGLVSFQEIAIGELAYPCGRKS
jgi:hypothetical protein